MSYKQGHLLAAFRERVFHLSSSSSGNPVLGATFATTDLQVRKPGQSAYANCDATQQSAVVELGGGDYLYVHTPTELNTIGTGLSFKIGKASCVGYSMVDTVDPAYFATAITGTLSSIAFSTDRVETTDDFWKDALAVALSGALTGQVKKVGGYTGSSKVFALAAGLAFTGAPSNGDVFELLVR